jgi:hypothetical protein
MPGRTAVVETVLTADGAVAVVAGLQLRPCECLRLRSHIDALTYRCRIALEDSRWNQ